MYPSLSHFFLCVAPPCKVAFFPCCDVSPPLWPPEVSALHSVAPLPFLCRPQHIGAPCKVAIFPCHNVPLPLRSSEVSALHWVALFPCPDRSLLLRAPTCQCPLRHIPPDSMGTHSPSCSGVSTQCQASTCSDVSHLPSPPALPYAQALNTSDAAMVALSAPPADPMPAVPLAMASAVPTTRSAPPYLCMSMPGGPTSFVSVLAFMTVPGLHSHLPYSATYVRACLAVAPVPALLAVYTHALLPSHIAITSPRLGNATSCITVAATANVCHYRLRHHHHHHHHHCGHQHQKHHTATATAHNKTTQ